MNVGLGTTVWTKAEDNAATSLSKSTAFQQLVAASGRVLTDEGRYVVTMDGQYVVLDSQGTDTENAAWNSIYINDLPDPEDGNRYSPEEYRALLPFGLVSSSAEDGFLLDATAVGGYEAGGTIIIEVQAIVESAYDALGLRSFMDTFGTIAVDIINLGETPGCLARPNVSGFQVLVAKEARESAGLSNVFGGVLALNWGMQGQE